MSSLVPDGLGGVEICFDLLDHIVTGSAPDGRRAVGRALGAAEHRQRIGNNFERFAPILVCILLIRV
jgi:hypothetical protein